MNSGEIRELMVDLQPTHTAITTAFPQHCISARQVHYASVAQVEKYILELDGVVGATPVL